MCVVNGFGVVALADPWFCGLSVAWVLCVEFVVLLVDVDRGVTVCAAVAYTGFVALG